VKILWPFDFALTTVSVTAAFIVAGVNPSCVRISALAELARRVVSPNTSPSTSELFPGLLIRGSYHLASPQNKLYKIHNLTDEEATLLEPAACAIHGLDKLNPPVGIDVLLLGAGPTGLILAQLLKLNGARKVTLAANKGIKDGHRQAARCC
jgi:D-arabinose 1-dehydrogenase-like Zn-dependent alcohol dehydrogenase